MYELVPLEIAASGLSAQRARMAVTSSNLANASSTRRPDGPGPYQRQIVVVEAQDSLPAFQDLLTREITSATPVDPNDPFADFPEDDFARIAGLEPARSGTLLEEHLRGVSLKEIRQLDQAIRYEYDPAHPDADERGMVAYPDISVMTEMTDMIMASRNYEANLAVMKTTRDMVLQTVELMRQ